jgi:hypothetical protein
VLQVNVEEYRVNEGGELHRDIRNVIPDFLYKYGNFDLAMDAFYHQENLCLQGMRCLYFPVDPSYEDYTRLMNANLIQLSGKHGNPATYRAISSEDYLKNGFNNFIYVMGAPANTACFKIDIYCNFECLPSSSFLNYLPLSMSTDFVSGEQKRRATLIVQQTPIGKADDEKSAPTPAGATPSIWDRMKQKFKDGLPNLAKTMGAVLVNAVPALKPAAALYNSMVVENNKIPL